MPLPFLLSDSLFYGNERDSSKILLAGKILPFKRPRADKELLETCKVNY